MEKSQGIVLKCQKHQKEKNPLKARKQKIDKQKAKEDFLNLLEEQSEKNKQ